MASTEGSRELTEDELRAYVERLREAEAAEIVAQAYTMLGTAAEVKLGRRDARVLIDGMAGLVQAAGPHLGDLGRNMQQGVGQLQMAQVQAERQAAAQAGGEPGADEPGQEQAPQEPAGQPGPPGGQGRAARGAASSPGAGRQPGGGQRMTDRLWVPGRDPGPGRR